MSSYFSSSKRKGSITYLTAAVGVLVISIAALVTDVGYMYYEHSKLQTATNAAWKAGYDKMTELRKVHNPLTAEDQNVIKAHMAEVMAANGYANMTAEQLKILFTENQTNLKIVANNDVDLFFMNIFDLKTAKVAAGRGGKLGGNDEASSILPVAIPHGEVHDLSWKTYDWTPFNNGEGFATGTEYIIKLGEAEGKGPMGDEEYMIYIPTGLSGSQSSDSKTMLAYGAIFWALQIDETDKDALTPAYWLLSENGGGFLMRTSQEFENRLRYGDYAGVYYEKVTPDRICQLLGMVGSSNVTPDYINEYLTDLAHGVIKNSQILPLTWRPQIAIYSSQDALDPVEEILVASKIPYGNYALPPSAQNPAGWRRSTNYNADYNTKIFDIEILNNELDKFDWIHLHHEDFTGLTVKDGSAYCNGTFPTACQRIKPGCPHNIAVGTKKSDRNRTTAINNLLNLACTSCKSHITYNVTSQQVRSGRSYVTMYYAEMTGWDMSEAELNANCKTAQLSRCGECGSFDPNNLGNQTNFSGCKFYNYLHEHFGYTDDVSIPYTFVTNDLTLSAADLCMKWFSKATAYQKMKWDVARKVKEHISNGGFMYTQCFAAETLDLSLQQGAFYDTRDLQASYDACMTYQNFTYKQLPKKNGYSSIYNSTNGNGTVQSNYKLSPLCQVSGKPNSGAGATSSFSNGVIKDGIEKLSRLDNNTSAWQYLGGKLTTVTGEKKGQFALMGGHNAQNINAKRFVLNNILYGSTSDKETSLGTHLVGKTKYQYGCIDPDNDGQKSSDDYLNRLLYGYNQPLNFADIISTDNNKYTSESTNGTNILTGKTSMDNYAPNTIVIVPIIGVPDSVKQYQSTLKKTSDADVDPNDLTIYDIKVGQYNSGAADSDNLGSKTAPEEIETSTLKNSVQVIGFAKFRIMAPEEYERDDLGEVLSGQIRGEFLGYVVDPREVSSLLAQYN